MQGELQSLAEYEDQQLSERVMRVLPLASDLLEAAIAGMRDLDGGVPPGRPGGRGVPDVRELSEIEWLRVLEPFGVPNDPLTRMAIHDLRHALNSAQPGSRPSAAEICTALEAVRVQVDELAEADPDTLPVAMAAAILRFAAQLARAVAVGLLVAAASAASAGAGVVSALLPAAVAAVASSLCDQLGKALGPAAGTLTPGECLTNENGELARMLDDLATRVGQNRNDALVDGTATVAVITSIHAKNLARRLTWPSADDYADDLEGIRKELIRVTGMTAATGASRPDLAKWLSDTAGQLRSWAIPPDLVFCRTIADQPSASHPAGTEIRASAGPASVTNDLNPGERGQAVQPAEHALDSEVLNPARPAAADAEIHDGVTAQFEPGNKTGEPDLQPTKITPPTSAAAGSEGPDRGPANPVPASETKQLFDKGRGVAGERDVQSEADDGPADLGGNLRAID